MEGINIQDRLEYARAAVAVLRALKITDTTMRYGELARAIGLIPDNGKWQPWHRQQVADILQIVAAAERQGHAKSDIDPLEYDRIVTVETGEAGQGVKKNSRIVRK